MSQPAMDYQTIAWEQQGPVLHLWLNRPEARNAMSVAMVAELRHALRAAEALAGTPQAVRVVVLRGRGGHFCAGGDLKDMAQARMQAQQALQAQQAPQDAEAAAQPLAAVSAAFGQLCLDFDATPLALVAVLQGSVMGGGLGLACVADVALADDSALFRLPETAMGVVPAQIAPFLLQRLGASQARRLAVTGARLDAQAALSIGLVHAVAPAAALEPLVQSTVQDILACAPGALAATKALMRQAQEQSAAQVVPAAAGIFAAAVLGDEGQEGTLAFLQKRKPQWAPT